eukprot:CAMPEP_0119201986 /NCGR_PEP_ID=MMETSP1316-20130426/30695_1 /TAXON_ID=41880 /ORGANISM="Pycnococcus provasolii, Strain RCC2336" /LENGTH=56 /DNA_ID=CAMNT_0007198151 /DNA_START=18 /DNA_END=185 /DNA_ORIENTATION=+
MKKCDGKVRSAHRIHVAVQLVRWLKNARYIASAVSSRVLDAPDARTCDEEDRAATA